MDILGTIGTAWFSSIYFINGQGEKTDLDGGANPTLTRYKFTASAGTFAATADTVNFLAHPESGSYGLVVPAAVTSGYLDGDKLEIHYSGTVNGVTLDGVITFQARSPGLPSVRF